MEVLFELSKNPGDTRVTTPEELQAHFFASLKCCLISEQIQWYPAQTRTLRTSKFSEIVRAILAPNRGFEAERDDSPRTTSQFFSVRAIAPTEIEEAFCSFRVDLLSIATPDFGEVSQRGTQDYSMRALGSIGNS